MRKLQQKEIIRLIGMLKGKDPALRMNAIVTLGESHNKSALPALRELLPQSTDSNTKEEILKAIESIKTGKKGKGFSDYFWNLYSIPPNKRKTGSVLGTLMVKIREKYIDTCTMNEKTGECIPEKLDESALRILNMAMKSKNAKLAIPLLKDKKIANRLRAYMCAIEYGRDKKTLDAYMKAAAREPREIRDFVQLSIKVRQEPEVAERKMSEDDMVALNARNLKAYGRLIVLLKRELGGEIREETEEYSGGREDYTGCSAQNHTYLLRDEFEYTLIFAEEIMKVESRINGCSAYSIGARIECRKDLLDKIKAIWSKAGGNVKELSRLTMKA